MSLGEGEWGGGGMMEVKSSSSNMRTVLPPAYIYTTVLDHTCTSFDQTDLLSYWHAESIGLICRSTGTVIYQETEGV